MTEGATARPASATDLSELDRLYHLLATEMESLRPVWPLTDGVAEPTADTLRGMLDAPDWTILLGLLDGVSVGFLAWCDEPMLPQAGGDRIASVRLLFTETEARRVGVGEAMITLFLEQATTAGFHRFDAHVSPGHREAKNFFEANGFSARSIVMYRQGD